MGSIYRVVIAAEYVGSRIGTATHYCISFKRSPDFAMEEEMKLYVDGLWPIYNVVISNECLSSTEAQRCYTPLYEFSRAKDDGRREKPSMEGIMFRELSLPKNVSVVPRENRHCYTHHCMTSKESGAHVCGHEDREVRIAAHVRCSPL